jgi:hypothetical protein
MTHFGKSWTVEDEKEYLKHYYQLHKKEIKERTKNHYQRNKKKHLAESLEWGRKHPEKKNQINKKCYNKRRLVILNHYSNNTCACAFCGIKDIRVLSIDHVEGGGKEHLRKIGFKSIYDWLLQNHLPPGFQVLCMNCQFIKRHTRNECKRKPKDTATLTQFIPKETLDKV